MIHCTCLAHGFSRVGDFISNKYDLVNKFISNMKKIFVKCPSRRELFEEYSFGVPLPPKPIVTRWGTWLNAVRYYASYFELIEDIVYMFDSDEAVCISVVHELLKNEHLKSSILYISHNLSFLSDKITQLENPKLFVVDCFNIIEECNQKLRILENKVFHEKFKNAINKNPDINNLREIIDSLYNEQSLSPQLRKIYTLTDLQKYKYVPLTSCDVERSFSQYKLILSDRRRSFKLSTLRNNLIIKCNNLEV